MGDSTFGYPEPPGYNADIDANPDTIGYPVPLLPGGDGAVPGGAAPAAVTGGRVDARPAKVDLRMNKRFTLTQGTTFSDDLGFVAKSVIIDNNTGQWLYESASRRYVPPGIFGAVLQFPSGSQVGNVLWNPPPGVTQPAGVAGSQAVLIYCEDMLDPSSGVVGSPATAGGTTVVAGASTPADATANPTNAVPTEDFNMVWNGATWDRWAEYPATALSSAAPTGIGMVGLTAQAGAGAAGASSLRTGTALSDGQGGNALAGAPALYNNATWDRQRSASAANLNAKSGLGAALVQPIGQTITSSNPAAGTAASASVAAGGAGVRNVCVGVNVVLSATTALAAITTVTFNLRDGATGAGTILASWQVTLPASTLLPTTLVSLTGLSIPGTAATAMTLEGSAAVGNLMESATLITTQAS